MQNGLNAIFTSASLHILLLGGLSATEMAIFQLNVKLVGGFPITYRLADWIQIGQWISSFVQHKKFEKKKKIEF